jgi:phosphoglycolate phosphatase
VLRAIIFDLDGTLLDTPAAIVRVARAATGRPDADEALVRAGIGLPVETVLARVLGADEGGPEVAAARDRFRDAWRAEVVPRLADLVFPGVRAGLAALRAAGLKLGVATGKLQVGADRTVDAAGLRAYFEVVAGHDRVERPKPHGDLARLVLRELGVAADEAVVVGDSALDVAMARAAGVRSLAVTYGAQGEADLRAAGPTWLAPSFAAVVDRLRPG